MMRSTSARITKSADGEDSEDHEGDSDESDDGPTVGTIESVARRMSGTVAKKSEENGVGDDFF